MEDVFIWVVFIFFLVGTTVIESCSDHNEKMECIKQRGEWVKNACKFPDPKPQAPR